MISFLCCEFQSQQDLTLDDLDEFKEDKKGRSKHSRSPEREGSTGPALRNDKSIWDTPHMTAEQEKNETEGEIFRKFGITFSSANDNEEPSEDKEEDKATVTPRSQTEESTLLPCRDDYNYASLTRGPMTDVDPSFNHSPGKVLGDTAASANRSNIERGSSGQGGHKKKTNKDKHRSSSSKKELPEAERALIPELSLNITEQQSQQDRYRLLLVP